MKTLSVTTLGAALSLSLLVAAAAPALATAHA